jgi:hypothetical protein
MIRTQTFLIFLTAIFLMTSCVTGNRIKLSVTGGIDDKKAKKQIERNTSLLLTSLENSTIGCIVGGAIPDTSGIAITQEAAQTLFSIWTSAGVMHCPVSKVKRKCLHRPQGGYQVREIPVSMIDAPENDRKRNLVINYTGDGTIDDIFVAADEKQINLIFENNVSAEDHARRTKIADFVEQYLTAYYTKDIEHIRKVFSNNALSRKAVMENLNSDQVMKSIDPEKIKYQTQTKGEYVEELARIFATNKYINILFEDIEIMRHPQYKEIYGVSLKQKWNTAHYIDAGYLFFMIDFKDDNNPRIRISVWQPEESGGKELLREERFNLNSFDKLSR